MARNVESGYSVIAIWALRNSSVVNSGVVLNSVMLARIGICIVSVNWRYMASSVIVFGNNISVFVLI